MHSPTSITLIPTWQVHEFLHHFFEMVAWMLNTVIFLSASLSPYPCPRGYVSFPLQRHPNPNVIRWIPTPFSLRR